MRFRGGRNIAMKVPPHRWAQTVEFYERTLALRVLRRDQHSVAFEFGTQRLWIDRVEHQTRAEVWLEIVADDVSDAADKLAAAGVTRCDSVEPLPDGFEGFWISNPADVVHLVAWSDQDD